MDLSLYLESRNISKKEFALMVGVSPGAISNYCSRMRIPTLEIALKIVEKTNKHVTLKDLLKK